MSCGHISSSNMNLSTLTKLEIILDDILNTNSEVTKLDQTFIFFSAVF